MNVFVLEGLKPYETSTAMGVYATRLEAIHAAMVHQEADKAEQYPLGFDYYIHEVVLGAPAQDRILEGEEILAGE